MQMVHPILLWIMVIVYSKTGMDFITLKIIWRRTFDNCMHTYFDKWKFKHPKPHDLESIFIKSNKNLSGFLMIT